MRGVAMALGVVAAMTAAPAFANCYKLENQSSAPRVVVVLGSGGLTTTIAPAATWPERGAYCVYGLTVTVKVEPPGSFAELGSAAFTGGDGPTALKSGTYIVK